MRYPLVKVLLTVSPFGASANQQPDPYFIFVSSPKSFIYRFYSESFANSFIYRIYARQLSLDNK